MVEKRKPIPVEKAVDLVMDRKIQGNTEIVSLEQADNRRLAEEIIATHPIPPFNKSPYDGFAFRSEDTEGASKDSPAVFEVVERIGAGSRASRSLKPGQAVRIMTGAELPQDADCVAMFEICNSFTDEGKDYMSLKRKMEPGQNVIATGSETAANEKLVEKGTIINPGVKALLATFGYATVKVVRKPVVGVFATGSELLDVDQELEPGKIRNSNAYMIASQIGRAGGEVKYYGKLEDDFQTSYQAVNKAWKEVDFLVTTGGVSVGDFDLLPDIYKKMEAKVLFNKVGMRPGSVTTAAEKDGKLLFGLSGNPSACYVGFELFVRPLLRSFLLEEKPYAKMAEAELEIDFPKPNPFTRFVRSAIDFQGGKIRVKPVGMDKSAVVTSLAFTNALMILPGSTRGYQAGDKVSVLLIDNLEGQKSFGTIK
ncbi:gephyrin-like molybdotransferase Glp [Sediminibacillus massiliensis]|uniref:molybdopterin molybdotransferase MoeA n=1 Tax=Sediminibacillus massiliensis TaxID=1926277 RepID=UPI0009888383|nr:gephyrin-like molybdotransferase Glp [Sediminibacillus massiliensis]